MTRGDQLVTGTDCPAQLNGVELSHGHPGAIAIEIGAA
jgi:hypothetical protein